MSAIGVVKDDVRNDLRLADLVNDLASAVIVRVRFGQASFCHHRQVLTGGVRWHTPARWHW